MPDLSSEYLESVPGNLQVNILAFKLEAIEIEGKWRWFNTGKVAIISMIDSYNKCQIDFLLFNPLIRQDESIVDIESIILLSYSQSIRAWFCDLRNRTPEWN